MSLKSLLDRIQIELKEKDEVKEELRRDMRRATRLSKQAILFTHQERFGDAKELLKEAIELFTKLEKVSKNYPDLVYRGMVDAAYQEYAEAQVFLTLVRQEQFPDPRKLNVPSTPYVLGLADVIGELRRRSLDLLRKGDVRTAEKCLEIMEHIYVEMTAMDDAYLLVPGLRRKCDVARRIIEATRGDVTIEARRNSLGYSIEELKKSLRRERKLGKLKPNKNSE
jgi:translin